MAAYSIREARSKFSTLLGRAAEGEEVLISEEGKPMWKIVPLHVQTFENSPYRRPGPGSQGDWSDLLKALDEPWDEEEQRAFGMID